jgi:hypothetical protein
MPVNWSRVPQKKTSWFFMQEKGLFSHPSRIFSTLHLTFVVWWWHLGFWKGLKTDLSQTSVSYTGKISPNFDLKNMISIQRIFHEKMVQICQILNLKTFQIARVLWQFPEGSQEYRRMLFFFLPSYLLCSQIWLNYLLDDHHFGYITKSLKKCCLLLYSGS